jgi:CHRD domain-containing protein
MSFLTQDLLFVRAALHSRRTRLLVGASMTAAVAGTSVALGSSAYKLTASLSAKQVVPAPRVRVAAAGGHFTATLTKNGSGGSLVWKLTLTALSGPPTVIETRFGGSGATGALAVTLCGKGTKPCPLSGTVSVSGTVAELLPKKLIYVSVDTAKNPNGEVRGEITAK